jgi:LacI family transcriptional regulator
MVKEVSKSSFGRFIYAIVTENDCEGDSKNSILLKPGSLGMKLKNATIKDIARVLNLSTSTVSRALRSSYEISPETKKLVLEYAEKINYRPNPIALSLKEKKSRAIGVIVSEIANNFFSQAINGIESIAYNRGYHVIITQSHESAEREKVNVEQLASRGVDGLLVSLSSETFDVGYLKKLNEEGLPLVFFDRVTNEIDTHKVVANNYLGAFHATEHLILQGFKKIAHITSSPYLSITKERLDGYKAALSKHNLPFKEELVVYCSHGGMILAEVDEGLNSLFKSKAKPDAIFTAVDRLTTTCFSIIKRMTLKKNEVGFAGFTNTPLADLFSPPLTVIQQPAFEIGQAATEFLIQMIESKKPVTVFENKILETNLIIRESSSKKQEH